MSSEGLTEVVHELLWQRERESELLAKLRDRRVGELRVPVKELLERVAQAAEEEEVEGEDEDEGEHGLKYFGDHVLPRAHASPPSVRSMTRCRRSLLGVLR